VEPELGGVAADPFGDQLNHWLGEPGHHRAAQTRHTMAARVAGELTLASGQKQERDRHPFALLRWTTNRSVTWPHTLHPVHRHDVGACELPTGASASIVAVAMSDMSSSASERLRAGPAGGSGSRAAD
jgi:hypothetical protein